MLEPLGERKVRSFHKEAAELEPLNVLGTEYPRMQILTVEEILAGQRFDTPAVAGRHTLEPRLPGIIG